MPVQEMHNDMNKYIYNEISNNIIDITTNSDEILERTNNKKCKNCVSITCYYVLIFIFLYYSIYFGFLIKLLMIQYVVYFYVH